MRAVCWWWNWDVEMSSLFLSGSTGLLGAYLVRDLMLAGVNLVVLTRSTRMESARQRMESLIGRWEREAGYALPRPVILEGDLKHPGLGLTSRDTKWVQAHCHAFMNNAASLTFYGNGRTEEPYLSNLNGTRNVLEFCSNADIREFHHVSTAYVCGTRRGRVLESELDVGQEHGNDYEISKFESEQLVRAAGFLTDLTVYRPGIIVGDAQTGFTTTFHGFYVPLKLVSTLMARTRAVGVSRDELESGVRTGGAHLMRHVLNTTGHEKKNLVPVDWVAAVMSHIYCQSRHHGQTYHLTPKQSVPVAVMQQAIEDSFIKYASMTSKAAQTAIDFDKFGEYFYEQMLVYRSYWGDDPEFDCSNTLAAAPHLPCPEVDAELLQRQCKFAIESNFGWPKARAAKLNTDVDSCLAPLLNAEGNTDLSESQTTFIGLNISGNGGGRWELSIHSDHVVAAEVGISDRCTAIVYLNASCFSELMSGVKTVEQAVNSGHIHIEGAETHVSHLTQGIQELISRSRLSRMGTAESACWGDLVGTQV